jgi:hypothetical protein
MSSRYEYAPARARRNDLSIRTFQQRWSIDEDDVEMSRELIEGVPKWQTTQ